MRKKIAIVDGYNVIYRSPELRRRLDISLLSAREGLIECCQRWLSGSGTISEFVIVFDGNSSVMPVSGSGGGYGVRVVFTATKEDADDRILDLVRNGGASVKYVVISSDNYVTGNARRHGAEVMSSSDFLAVPGVKSRCVRKASDKSDEIELSPVEEREINESLKKEWGIE